MATPAHISSESGCSNCNKPDYKAIVRCLDCREYLCQKCYTSHSALKSMKDHSIITMADINTGKVNLQNEEKYRFCKKHGKMNEFYCDVEKRPVCKDCVLLNECPSWHRRINLRKASQIHSDQLMHLIHKSKETLQKYNDAFLSNRYKKHELEIRSKKQHDILKNAEKDCKLKVKQVFQEFQNDLVCTKEKKMSELDQIDNDLLSSIAQIKRSTSQCEHLIQTKSEFEIVSAQSTLSRQLQTLSTRQPKGAAKHVSLLEFEVAIPATKEQLEQVLKTRLRRQKWQLVGEFNTGEFDRLTGLCLDGDGYIALCSLKKGLKVFSRNGGEICTVYNSPGANGVCVNFEYNYMSISKGKKLIKINDTDGEDINSIPIIDVNDKRSCANSITVDSLYRTIVGQVNNTISIHNTGGKVICKFATRSRISRLAATSNGQIVCSIYDAVLKRSTSVQLMDYCGGIVRVLEPPDEVKVWSPGSVCCGKGDIFVANSYVGDPSGVYVYNSEGDYLGCVTTEVPSPSGIALSKDGMELFVADFSDACVKIFHRP